jgi:hypothetical protein
VQLDGRAGIHTGTADRHQVRDLRRQPARGVTEDDRPVAVADHRDGRPWVIVGEVVDEVDELVGAGLRAFGPCGRQPDALRRVVAEPGDHRHRAVGGIVQLTGLPGR